MPNARRSCYWHRTEFNPGKSIRFYTLILLYDDGTSAGVDWQPSLHQSVGAEVDRRNAASGLLKNQVLSIVAAAYAAGWRPGIDQ